MQPKVIAYWITTSLIGLAFAASGIMELLGGPQVAEGLAHLGYPAYFANILGVWKLLGAAALLAPGLPRLKEWAYAGMFFDLTGAATSHAAVSDPIGNVMTPLVLAALLVASWWLRPASRVLGALPGSSAAARSAQPMAAPAA